MANLPYKPIVIATHTTDPNGHVDDAPTASKLQKTQIKSVSTSRGFYDLSFVPDAPGRFTILSALAALAGKNATQLRDTHWPAFLSVWNAAVAVPVAPTDEDATAVAMLGDGWV